MRTSRVVGIDTDTLPTYPPHIYLLVEARLALVGFRPCDIGQIYSKVSCGVDRMQKRRGSRAEDDDDDGEDGILVFVFHSCGVEEEVGIKIVCIWVIWHGERYVDGGWMDR